MEVTRSRFPAATGKAGHFDHFMMADTDGFAGLARECPANNDRNWLGGMNYREACDAAYAGHPRGVADSEAFMSKFEDMNLNSRRWKTLDAVAGGAPNVGAYLAGSPVAMRRRDRQVAQGAPLTIFCDMVSSGGIEAVHLKKRGAAVLALVRILSAARPVSLYGVGGLGCVTGTEDSAFCMIRLETPIDVSRAAFFLSRPAAQRGLLYRVVHHKVVADGRYCDGHWPYRNVDTYRTHGAKLYSGAIGADPLDCLFLPPVFLSDDTITNPVKWIKDMLAQYGGAPTEAAA